MSTLPAFAPDEGQSLSSFVDPAKFPKDLFLVDNGGFIYLNPRIFRENFANDVDPAEADIMAIVQKPFNQSIFAEKSGPPAWKQLPTWYQISDADHMIPPDVQRMFAERMNATTLSLNASHASYVSHPTEIADFILNGTKGRQQIAYPNNIFFHYHNVIGNLVYSESIFLSNTCMFFR